MSSSSRKQVPAPPAILQLQNRLSALEADKALGTFYHEVSELAEPELHSSTRRKQQVIVVGRGSLLRGTEGLICLPDLLSREVCCSLGPQFQDLVERLPNLVYLPGYYALPLFHVGNDIVRGDLEPIKQDYMALGARVKSMGGAGGFLLYLVGEGEGLV